MKKDDRMSMLKRLVSNNEEDLDVELFEDYVQNHYPEVYSFFSLVNDGFIPISEIEFDKPKVSETKFCFNCKMSKKNFNLINKMVEDKSGRVHYLRENPFKVSISGNFENASITFSTYQ